MEVFTKGVDVLRALVNTVGGAMVIVGLIMYFLAQGENNAANKQAGINLFIAGAGVAVIANTLVPMLGSMMG